ncbi:MAG: LytTR family DNA-binding domain-containing protein [Thermodesulfobacteriota bacterium]|nr:LytTR family DNA-binding domain-containing protein [Thermodesulfobacteriota bacterium]
MKIRCIIVDDEPPAVDELTYILSKIEDVEVVASSNSALKAINVIREKKPDLVFLDIHMPVKNGFHVARMISSFDRPPLIIFATAFDQYAVRAFEANAIDYVLKPFSENRIRKTIARAKGLLSSNSKTITITELDRLIENIGEADKRVVRISVENKGRILLLDPEKIFFCRSKAKKLVIYTQNNQFVCHSVSTLGKLETMLLPYHFFRSHRAYLVNLSRIREVIPWFNGRYLVHMSDEKSTEIPVSRSRARNFKNKLGI